MRQSTRQDYVAHVAATVFFVLGRLDDPPRPDEIAAEAGFSRHHFGRVFAAALGETIAEFVRRLKLERAAHQLCSSELSISEIALSAGYDSLEAFTRAFKAGFLMAPSEFRRKPSRPEIPAPSGVHYRPDLSVPTLQIRFIPGHTMTATIESVSSLHIVALRHVGPYHEIGSAFDKLSAWAFPAGVPVRGSVALYHDDPGTTPPAELRSDAAFVVPEDYSMQEGAPEGVRLETVPGGEYAVVTHKGSYSGLGDAWNRFMTEVNSLGREMIDPCYELYLNDPCNTPEDELETRLYQALAPAG